MLTYACYGWDRTNEGNRDALSWLRGEQSIFVPDENRERNVRLIDFDNPGKNLFHVTDEWVQRGAVYRNRADVVFLINGLPVAVAETKKTAKPDGLEEGVAHDGQAALLAGAVASAGEPRNAGKAVPGSN